MEFLDLNGKVVKVAKSIKPYWRPAVYGVLVKDNKILCIKPNWDKTKLCLPGGSIDLGEEPSEAVARECLEETGFEVKMLDTQPIFIDSSLYAEPENNKYFQRINFYFEIEIIRKTNNKLDKETNKLMWKDLSKTKVKEFTFFQQEFIKTKL